MFSATTAFTLVALVAFLPVASARALLLMFASSCAPLTASTVMWPSTSTTVSSIEAVASEPSSLPKTCPPIRSSIVLNRAFCADQPMLLKASVTSAAVAEGGFGFAVFPAPLPELPETVTITSAAFTTSALISAVLEADTIRLAEFSVSTWLSPISAVAPLSTTFVAIMPATPRDEPVGALALPPNFFFLPLIVSVACNWLSVVAVRVAVSSARTSMMPPVASSRALVAVAVAPPWTLFSDTAPATPMELDCGCSDAPPLPPPVAVTVTSVSNVMVASMWASSVARTWMPPPARTPSSTAGRESWEIDAWALLLTLFSETTAPRAKPRVFGLPVSTSAVEVLLTSASSCESAVAVTVTTPVAVTIESTSEAVALDPTSSPKASSSSAGVSRNKASRSLKRTLFGDQPMLLKASVTPTS